MISALKPVVLSMALIAVGCGDDDGLRADAGPDTTVLVGEVAIFDGCQSTGDIANYQWRIQETPSGVADDVGKVLRETDSGCSFTLETAMVVDEVGTWTIELEVADSSGATSTDSVEIDVE